MDLKRFLRDLPGSAAGAGETHRVMLALRTARPDRASLDRLRSLGLNVEQVIGSTVIGSARGDAVAALRRDPEVLGVEPSVRLEKHAGR